MRSSGAIKSASPLMSIMESAAFVYASRSISVTMLTSERFSSIFIAAFGSDPSVYDIHVFIFLEFGMFGSGKGKKAEREKEMQKAPSELAEKYPMPQKHELALEEGNGETAKRLLALLASGERSRSELAAELGVSSQPWLSAAYLNPLMKQGYIAQTLPQKPKSPLQRYRLLRKGREVLA